MTAWGVFCGMRAAAAEAGLGDDLRGARVAVQGAGHVGAGLVRHLLDAGAEVTVADIYPERVAPLVALGATACPPESVHAPGVRRVRAVRARRGDPARDGRTSCAAGSSPGAANNQLLDSSMGDALHTRSIVYAPDFVINAGGVINIAEELGRPYDADRARRSVERIADTLTAVFARSRGDNIAPHVAADRLAEERIAAARATATGCGRRPVPAGMIPLKDNVPTRHLPILTLALIVANLAIFVWAQHAPSRAPARRTSACALPVSGFTAVTAEFGFVPCEVQETCPHGDDSVLLGYEDGRPVYARVHHVPVLASVLTAMFMHGSWEHVLGNMLFLWIFGNNIEDRVGRRRFLVFYLLGGLLAGAAPVPDRAGLGRAQHRRVGGDRGGARAATWSSIRAPR